MPIANCQLPTGIAPGRRAAAHPASERARPTQCATSRAHCSPCCYVATPTTCALIGSVGVYWPRSARQDRGRLALAPPARIRKHTHARSRPMLAPSWPPSANTNKRTNCHQMMHHATGTSARHPHQLASGAPCGQSSLRAPGPAARQTGNGRTWPPRPRHKAPAAPAAPRVARARNKYARVKVGPRAPPPPVPAMTWRAAALACH